MDRIGVRELRQHASRYLARVKAGETIEVTDRGRLVARLVPAAPADSARERHVATGLLIPGKGNPLRLPTRRPVTGSSEDVLDDLRSER